MIGIEHTRQDKYVFKYFSLADSFLIPTLTVCHVTHHSFSLADPKGVQYSIVIWQRTLSNLPAWSVINKNNLFICLLTALYPWYVFCRCQLRTHWGHTQPSTAPLLKCFVIVTMSFGLSGSYFLPFHCYSAITFGHTLTCQNFYLSQCQYIWAGQCYFYILFIN